jgi:hypothetical protein
LHESPDTSKNIFFIEVDTIHFALLKRLSVRAALARKVNKRSDDVKMLHIAMLEPIICCDAKNCPNRFLVSREDQNGSK